MRWSIKIIISKILIRTIPSSNKILSKISTEQDVRERPHRVEVGLHQTCTSQHDWAACVCDMVRLRFTTHHNRLRTKATLPRLEV